MNFPYKYRYYYYPLAVFFFLIIILLGLKVFQKENVKLVSEVKKVPVETKIIFPKSIKPQFLFFGRISGKNEIDIISRLSGKVIFVSKKLFNSSDVIEGETLFKLDSFEHEQDVIRKKSALDELKIELEKTNLLLAETVKQLNLAKEDYNRKKKLFGNTVSQKALDDSALKVSEAKTRSSKEKFKINTIKLNIRDAEAALKLANKNLSFTNYKAPFFGKITNNKIDLGSEIKAGNSLARIINTSELEVKFFVGEGKFTELGTNNELIGSDIVVRWKKSKFNKLYNAKLTRIDSVVDETTAGLNMYAKLKNISKEDPIRPGVFVEVLLKGSAIENAIEVPESVVYEEKYIYILEESKAVRVEVKVEGYIDNQLIISGDFVPSSKIILTRLDSFQTNDSYYSISESGKYEK